MLACLASTASEYLRCFSLSADENTASTGLWRYHWASVSTTWISNNAPVCGCHTPRMPRSAINAAVLLDSSASLTTSGLLITSLYARVATLPSESLTSLCLCIVKPPFLQSKACSKLVGAPHPMMASLRVVYGRRELMHLETPPETDR